MIGRKITIDNQPSTQPEHYTLQVVSPIDKVERIVAVRHPPLEEHDQTIAVVSPCGACRELIFDYDPKARVIVPNGPSPSIVPIAELLPNKYTRGPKR